MSKIKIKSVRKQLSDKSVINMFNQMLGTEDADPSIVTPKYIKIKGKIKSLSKILSAATEDVIRKSFPDESDSCDDIIKYVNALDNIIFLDIPPSNEMTLEVSKKINEEYKILKSNNDIKVIILTCKNLIGYSNNLSSNTDFDDSFISRIPGFEFIPFPFSRLNIKNIWSSPLITEHIKKYMFTVMKIVLEISKDIYKTLTSPDVDVKEFSKAIISSIAQVKKQIPRCDKAFRKIEDSVGLLEGNFDEYYKDFIQSQNPSTIIESFVIDVSNTGGADSETTRQFRKIINYYRNATQGKIKDPKIKKVFDMLNENFSAMEINTNDISEKKENDNNKSETKSDNLNPNNKEFENDVNNKTNLNELSNNTKKINKNKQKDLTKKNIIDKIKKRQEIKQLPVSENFNNC
jgi:hypothetical protein